MKFAAILSLLGALICAPLDAAQIEQIKVDHANGQYNVSMRVLLEVPAARAYAVFADPQNLTTINPAVQEVRVLPEGRLYTQVRTCAGPFCKTFRQQQQMRYELRSNGGHIWAQVIPGESDLRSGSAQWEFRADGKLTQLEFDAVLEPDFWIPPLIGPWLVENSMRDEAQRTSAGIEQLARESQ